MGLFVHSKYYSPKLHIESPTPIHLQCFTFNLDLVDLNGALHIFRSTCIRLVCCSNIRISLPNLFPVLWRIQKGKEHGFLSTAKRPSRWGLVSSFKDTLKYMCSLVLRSTQSLSARTTWRLRVEDNLRISNSNVFLILPHVDSVGTFSTVLDSSGGEGWGKSIPEKNINRLVDLLWG